MKKVLAYTEKELERFQEIYTFLNDLYTELDTNRELTADRELLLDEAYDKIAKLEKIFDK